MSGDEQDANLFLWSDSFVNFTSPMRRRFLLPWGVNGIDTKRPETFINRKNLVDRAMEMERTNYV
jgi:hypothetical protein